MRCVPGVLRGRGILLLLLVLLTGGGALAPAAADADADAAEAVLWYPTLDAAYRAAGVRRVPVFLATHFRGGSAPGSWPADAAAWNEVYRAEPVASRLRDFACVQVVRTQAPVEGREPREPVHVVADADGTTLAIRKAWAHDAGEPSVGALVALLEEGRARFAQARSPRPAAPSAGGRPAAQAPPPRAGPGGPAQRPAGGRSALDPIPLPQERHGCPRPPRVRGTRSGASGRRDRDPGAREGRVGSRRRPRGGGARARAGRGGRGSHGRRALRRSCGKAEEPLELGTAPDRPLDRARRVLRLRARAALHGRRLRRRPGRRRRRRRGRRGRRPGGAAAGAAARARSRSAARAATERGATRASASPSRARGPAGGEAAAAAARRGARRGRGSARPPRRKVHKEDAVVAVPDPKAGLEPPPLVPLEEALREFERVVERAMGSERIRGADQAFLLRYFRALEARARGGGGGER